MTYTIKTEVDAYQVEAASLDMLRGALEACTPYGESLSCDIYIGDVHIEHVDIAPL